LWEAAGKQYLWTAVWSVMGSAGLMAAGLRSLSVLLSSSDDTPWKMSETRLEAFLLFGGIIALFAAGLLAQLYFPALTGLAQGLEYITP
jgi:hypothetical protein